MFNNGFWKLGGSLKHLRTMAVSILSHGRLWLGWLHCHGFVCKMDCDVSDILYYIYIYIYIYSDLKHTMDIHGLCITVDCDVPWLIQWFDCHGHAWPSGEARVEVLDTFARGSAPRIATFQRKGKVAIHGISSWETGGENKTWRNVI